MNVEALVFDVFGTCVDWRTGIAREVAASELDVEPLAFADHWRALYEPGMERIRAEGRPYVDLDVLHRENLDRTLAAFGISLDEARTDALNRAWEKLPPWPDTVPGLTRLHERFILSACSNGSIAMMARLARYAGLPWDAVLGAGIARDYKRKPVVYEAACAALRLEPRQVMMVAAHNDDLHAARACGLRTAFIPRTREYGPEQAQDLQADADWDVIAADMKALAGKLGC